MLKRVVSKHVSVITIIGLLIIWQLFGNFGLLPKYVLPTPMRIAEAFVLRSDLLFKHSLYTLAEAFIGLSISVVLAWLLAVLMESVAILHKALYPLFIMLQSVPTTALAPLLLLWLGYGMTPKIVLIVITTFFPMLISILDGFKYTDKDLIQLLELMQANKFQLLYHVKIPHSLTYFFAGLRVSVSYAFIAAVVSEWLGGFEGLGIYMMMAKKMFEYETMFAIIILIACISLFSMKCVVIIEKKVLHWKYKKQTN